MSKDSSSIPNRIASAAGLYPVLQERSKSRRDTQKRLTMQQGAAPLSRLRNDRAPELQVKYVATDSLKPANRRLRKAYELQAARIEQSIAAFGICIPILTDANGSIVHGHGVWEAARRAGLDLIPVIEVSHLPPEKLRLLAITLNRIAETGKWDEDVLAQELEELLDLGEDVLVTGFEMAEVDALLFDDNASEDDGVEDLPVLPVNAISQPGDLWTLGDHRLLQGDALDPANYALLTHDGPGARLILTDVPFNVPNVGHTTGKAHHREFAMAHGEMSSEEFAAFNQKWMGNAASVLMDGGLLATFIDWRSIEIILAVGRGLDLDLLNIVVWQKTNGGQGSLWRSQHELLPVLKKGKTPHINNVQLGRYGRYRTNVWTYRPPVEAAT